MDSPNEGDTVTGIITVRGWALVLTQVTDLGFGVDGKAIPTLSVQRGLYSPGACRPPSGRYWSTICNWMSGFAGQIDTRRLTNGLHTLQVTASGGTGIPTVFRRQVLVSNSCSDFSPPAVSISAPSFTVTGTVNVTASASDDTGVAGVDFYIDGNYVGTDSSAPFTYRWDSTSWPSGAHAVKVTAGDGCSNATTASATFMVLKDVTAPQVSILAPAQGAAVRGTLNMQAQSSDNFETTHVDFWVDGVLQGTDTIPPFTYAWSSTGDGSHSLTVKAYDAAGNVGIATADFIVDNAPPQLYLSSPLSNQTLSGSSFKLAGWATDRTGVNLSFALDGQILALGGSIAWLSRPDVCDSVPTGDPGCPNVGWRGFFDTTRFVNGWHTITVTATDGAGWSTSRQASVYVSNSIGTSQSSFNPAGDASTRQAFPDANYGSGNILGVRYSDASGDGQYSFLKFNVTGITGTVALAKLLLRTKTPLIELYLYKVDGSWTEAAITWNNMPASSAVELTHRLNLAAETWYDFDVTSYITGNGVYAFGIASADTGEDLGCYSRESPFAPTLQVNYQP